MKFKISPNLMQPMSHGNQGRNANTTAKQKRLSRAFFNGEVVPRTRNRNDKAFIQTFVSALGATSSSGLIEDAEDIFFPVCRITGKTVLAGERRINDKVDMRTCGKGREISAVLVL